MIVSAKRTRSVANKDDYECSLFGCVDTIFHHALTNPSCSDLETRRTYLRQKIIGLNNSWQQFAFIPLPIKIKGKVIKLKVRSQ
jgi:hypothetical protein